MSKSQSPIKHIDEQSVAVEFHGVIHVTKHDRVVYSKAFGMANRADAIPNKVTTRFAVASGSKLFTAVAVCQLVEKGLLSFSDSLGDCLDISLPHFSPEITVHHLLTHSAGIPDYWDEENQDFEDVWSERPVYGVKSPGDFLPMFRDSRMRGEPGEVFKYNDAGFILLGLIVEQKSGMRFQDYVQESILAACEMSGSGYFESDRLPADTALGYVEDAKAGRWKTNVFSVPIIGGPDGGAYTTAQDMSKFWTCLTDRKLLSNDITALLLTPHIEARDEGENLSYGYGIWIKTQGGEPKSFFVGGWDPGVNMLSEIYLDTSLRLSILGNTNRPILPLREAVISAFLTS